MPQVVLHPYHFRHTTDAPEAEPDTGPVRCRLKHACTTMHSASKRAELFWRLRRSHATQFPVRCILPFQCDGDGNDSDDGEGDDDSDIVFACRLGLQRFSVISVLPAYAPMNYKVSVLRCIAQSVRAFNSLAFCAGRCACIVHVAHLLSRQWERRRASHSITWETSDSASFAGQLVPITCCTPFASPCAGREHLRRQN